MILAMIVCMTPSVCLALDGKVTFGRYFNAENVRSCPDGGLAEFRSQVEVGHAMRFLGGTIRPYLNLTTLMDRYNGDGSFHPASIIYSLGLDWEKQITDRLYFMAGFSHHCWHPVDSGGTVDQADNVEIGFRF